MDPLEEIARLNHALRGFGRVHPLQTGTSEEFLNFLHTAAMPFHRENVSGHFTASCWLVSADGERVLLTHHRKLNRWLQLGGHADGDADLPAVCLREALEESGLKHLQLDPEIFDLDTHTIPARGTDPQHTHWDVRYVVRCAGAEQWRLSEESLALAWVPIMNLINECHDESLQRMARKWLARKDL